MNAGTILLRTILVIAGLAWVAGLKWCSSERDFLVEYLHVSLIVALLLTGIIAFLRMNPRKVGYRILLGLWLIVYGPFMFFWIWMGAMGFMDIPRDPRWAYLFFGGGYSLACWGSLLLGLPFIASGITILARWPEAARFSFLLARISLGLVLIFGIGCLVGFVFSTSWFLSTGLEIWALFVPPAVVTWLATRKWVRFVENRR